MSLYLIRKFLSNSKATQYCVAFFILLNHSVSVFALEKNDLSRKKLDTLKIKISESVIKKNRTEALFLLKSAESEIYSAEIRSQLRALKENILTLFLSQESQDLFESSASLMILKTRLAEKNIIKCLELEPENLYCKWQQLRILNYKNDPAFDLAREQFLADSDRLAVMGALAATLNLNAFYTTEMFQNLQKEFPVLFHSIEFSQAITAQNYSLAKEILQKLTALAPDYPDLIFMRSKLMIMSQEESAADQNSAAIYAGYKKTCAGLRPELTRKYYYDIHLCHRSL